MGEDLYTKKQLDDLSQDLKEINVENYPEVFDIDDFTLGHYQKVELAKILNTIDPMLTNQDMVFIFISVNNTTSLTKMVNYLVEKLRIHENYRLIDYKFNSVMTTSEAYDNFDFSVSLQFKSTV